MPTLNLAYIVELALKYGRYFLFVGMISIFVIVLFIMWGFFTTSFTYFYHHIQSFFDLVATGSGGGVLLDKFFGLLNCMGFVDAFTTASPAIVTALAFLIGSILYKITLVSLSYFYSVIKPLLK